jgi:hypothetical protein
MDASKFDYFMARYRVAEEEELIELASRQSVLAEEAQAALRQAAVERGLSLDEESQVALPQKVSRKAAQDAEETAYSLVRVELIQERKVWFLWSLPLSLGAGAIYGAGAESTKGTLMALPVASLGLFAVVWPLYCLYKLSRSVEPKRAVAWAMVATQFLPIIGWLAAISLVLKAGRIRKAASAAVSNNNAIPSDHAGT